MLGRRGGGLPGFHRGVGWGGVGWGGDGLGWGGVIPTQRLATLVTQHEIDATLLDLHWRFNMKLKLRYLIFTGASTWSVCWMPAHPTCPKCWIT